MIKQEASHSSVAVDETKTKRNWELLDRVGQVCGLDRQLPTVLTQCGIAILRYLLHSFLHLTTVLETRHYSRRCLFRPPSWRCDLAITLTKYSAEPKCIAPATKWICPAHPRRIACRSLVRSDSSRDKRLQLCSARLWLGCWATTHKPALRCQTSAYQSLRLQRGSSSANRREMKSRATLHR